VVSIRELLPSHIVCSRSYMHLILLHTETSRGGAVHLSKIVICYGKLYGNVHQAYQPRDKHLMTSYLSIGQDCCIYFPKSASRDLKLHAYDQQDVFISCTHSAVSYSNQWYVTPNVDSNLSNPLHYSSETAIPSCFPTATFSGIFLQQCT
jgi:hypothetical protein